MSMGMDYGRLSRRAAPVEPAAVEDRPIRVDRAAYIAIEDMALASADHRETGGWLWGTFSRTIDSVTGLGPTDKRAAAHLSMSPTVEDLARFDRWGLRCVGSWHSHPDGDAGLSDADIAAARNMCVTFGQLAMAMLVVTFDDQFDRHIHGWVISDQAVEPAEIVVTALPMTGGQVTPFSRAAPKPRPRARARAKQPAGRVIDAATARKLISERGGNAKHATPLHATFFDRPAA